MSYNYPPPGGARAPPNTGSYGQPPPGAPASMEQKPASFGVQPPSTAQSAPQYSGAYAPPGGPPQQRARPQYGQYGGAPPPAQPPPPQQQQSRQAPAAFGGSGSFREGAVPSNGVSNGMPPPPMTAPPMSGSNMSAQGQVPNSGTSGPSSTGRGAQFFSVGGAAVASNPTPLQGGPPVGPPGSAAPGSGIPPPPTAQSLAGQMGQMSLGPPPNGVGGVSIGAPGQSGGRVPGPTGDVGYGGTPASGPPGMQQPGYGGVPARGGYGPGPAGPGAYGPQTPKRQGGPGGAPGTAGAPLGAATSAAGQAVLPSIHETDMSVQADPRIMRMTVGAVPHSSSAHSQSKLPLGMVIQAMALDIEEENGGLDVVNFGAQGIIRCKRCRTYVNPFVSWLNNGRQWRCNVCGSVNDVPTSYFCHLDSDGQRKDKAERPELSKASVELVAPVEYMVRPPQNPVYMFLIDVSSPAVASGMVQVAADTIKACLDRLPGGERTLVGMCTFSSHVHFYNLKSSLSQPQMLVVPDLTEPFLPVPEDLLVNLSESRSVFDALLDSLAEMHSSTRDSECCLGSALTEAGHVMGHVGGKMMVMCSSLPSTGEARLKHRENPRNVGTEREHLMLKPEDPWYQNKAVEFSKMQICVDLFLFSAQYTDVATLATLPKFTAGQLFYYPGFMMDRDGIKFRAELTRVLTRATAFEAVMRVRATRVLRIENFYGNYYIRGTDLLALPTCTPDSVFAVEFGYDEQILNASVVSVQAALLYTTSSGERRIRVHNMAIPVETVIQNVFDSVNIDVVCNILAKQALEISLKSGLDSARGRIQQACMDIVRASRGGGFRSNMYMAPGQQQQSAPMAESIQLLPLYSMALQKNIAFRGGTDVRIDERSFVQHRLANMPVDHSRCFTYPRMLSLHQMSDDVGLPVEDGLSSGGGVPTAGKELIKLPDVANLSAERLSSDGIFLLENAVELLMFVGRMVDPALLQALFGVTSLEGVDVSSLQVLAEGNDLCRRVNNVIAALREERMTYLQVTVVPEGGEGQQRFFWHLVEDRAPFPGGSMNYAEYMEHISRQSFGGI